MRRNRQNGHFKAHRSPTWTTDKLNRCMTVPRTSSKNCQLDIFKINSSFISLAGLFGYQDEESNKEEMSEALLKENSLLQLSKAQFLYFQINDSLINLSE